MINKKDIEKYLIRDKEKFIKIFDQVEESLFLRKPNEKRWSAAECIEHLNNGCKMYIPEIKKALENSKETNQEFIKISWLQKKMIDLLEPPYKFKMPTGGDFIPSKNLSKEKVFNDYLSYQDEYIGLIKKYYDKDFNSVKFSSPAAKMLKFNSAFAILFNAAHQRRHIWQAEQTIKGFIQ
jgi:hypothetical protein